MFVRVAGADLVSNNKLKLKFSVKMINVQNWGPDKNFEIFRNRANCCYQKICIYLLLLRIEKKPTWYWIELKNWNKKLDIEYVVFTYMKPASERQASLHSDWSRWEHVMVLELNHRRDNISSTSRCWFCLKISNITTIYKKNKKLINIS